jgi:hypothetical protein
MVLSTGSGGKAFSLLLLPGCLHLSTFLIPCIVQVAQGTNAALVISLMPERQSTLAFTCGHRSFPESGFRPSIPHHLRTMAFSEPWKRFGEHKENVIPLLPTIGTTDTLPGKIINIIRALIINLAALTVTLTQKLELADHHVIAEASLAVLCLVGPGLQWD